MLVFDIETGPLPDEFLEKTLPELNLDKEAPHPGEFDPDEVKFGNVKDPAKRQVKLDEAMKKHEIALALCHKKRSEAVINHRQKHFGNAALSPTTGKVLAIGVMGDNVAQYLGVEPQDPPKIVPAILHGKGSERVLLEQIWVLIEAAFENSESVVGHNIYGFDLPFLLRRSWIMEVDIPQGIRERGRWCDLFVDTMNIWSCGTKERSSLDSLGKAIGEEGKLDGVTGKDFAKLWLGEPEEKALAEKYLGKDLWLTWRLAQRLGIF